QGAQRGEVVGSGVAEWDHCSSQAGSVNLSAVRWVAEAERTTDVAVRYRPCAKSPTIAAMSGRVLVLCTCYPPGVEASVRAESVPAVSWLAGGRLSRYLAV